MKKKTRIVVLCAGVALCMSVSWRTHVRADNAFVVEEEAIIGGESLQEGQGQTEAPVQVPPPAVQEPIVEQKHVGDGSKSRAMKEKKAEETEEETTEEASKVEKENETGTAASVSQNTGAPVFRVPIHKSETEVPEEKIEERDLQQPNEEEAQEEILHTSEPHSESVTETENPSASRNQNPWWVLTVGGVFFLGGCVRFLWRIRGTKG